MLHDFFTGKGWWRTSAVLWRHTHYVKWRNLTTHCQSPIVVQPDSRDKWSEIFIDFVTELPKSAKNHDCILLVANKATIIMHMASCIKVIIATNTA